jgi:hypothetical protein
LGWDAAGALACALCDARRDRRVATLAQRALADEADARAAHRRAIAATKV